MASHYQAPAIRAGDSAPHLPLRQDRAGRREQIWRHGRLWTALIIGIPAGLLFGLFQFGSSGRLEGAMFGGSFFGVIFGATMSILIWGRWKAAKKLSSQDRRAVALSVLKGEPIDDPRLAPAVIEYAEVVRGGHDRERRYSWMLWIWPTLTLAVAVAATVNGPTRQAVFFWGLVVFWIASCQRKKGEQERPSHAHPALRVRQGNSSTTSARSVSSPVHTSTAEGPLRLRRPCWSHWSTDWAEMIISRL
jgi:hypothetical protein